MNGHEEFHIKIVAARSASIAADGLDRMFKGNAHMSIVDSGPSPDKEDYIQFLVAVWIPVPPVKRIYA